MFKGIRFRVLALSQVVYESGLYLRDALKRRFGRTPKKSVTVKALDGTSFGEMRVTQGFTLSDLLPSCRELLRNSVFGGHVNPHLFCGVSCDNYPELDDPRTVDDDRKLLQVTMRHASSMATMGAGRSAYLPAYVDSQMRHLSGCQRCIGTVLGHIRDDLRSRAMINKMLAHAGLIRSSAPYV